MLSKGKGYPSLSKSNGYHQKVPTARIPLTLSLSLSLSLVIRPYRTLYLAGHLDGIQCLHRDSASIGERRL